MSSSNGNSRNSRNKCTLGTCEIFHPQLHGFNENSNQNIIGKFLLYETFDLDEFYNNEHITMLEIHNAAYNLFYENIQQHPIIRNFHNIVTNKNYFKLDIVESEVLPTLETICIIKTFWIKLIQRKWKKIYKHRMDIKKNPKYLLFRECRGKFPKKLN
jgi:hypothetical protein